VKITDVEAIWLRLPEIDERCDGTQDTFPPALAPHLAHKRLAAMMGRYILVRAFQAVTICATEHL
jgi:hypothetical protein